MNLKADQLIEADRLRRLVEQAITICGSMGALGRRLGSTSQKAPNFLPYYLIRKCEAGGMVSIKKDKLSQLQKIVEEHS